MSWNLFKKKPAQPSGNDTDPKSKPILDNRSSPAKKADIPASGLKTPKPISHPPNEMALKNKTACSYVAEKISMEDVQNFFPIRNYDQEKLLA
ncbi:MAG: hypothetical protein Q7T40_12855, partial [Methylobacter sp.]|nr:hypothetical protein [Methylobacter sp.]